MATTTLLRERTVKDLARMAKDHGVPGWHAMRKEELIKALLSRTGRPTAEAPKVNQPKAKSNGLASRPVANGVVPSEADEIITPFPSQAAAQEVPGSKASERARAALLKRTQLRDLSSKSESASAGRTVRDRLFLMVRDPYWIHAHWELSRATVERARAALGHEWHSARPILRVYRVCDMGLTSQADVHECDIDIHGGVNDWYIDVHTPPCTYRADIGYVTAHGRFHQLTRGNLVTTPSAGESGAVDRHWDDIAEDFDRIFAMSAGFGEEGVSEELREALEDRLRRPVQGRIASFFRGPADIVDGRADFQFHVDAEIIIHGTTRPDAYVKVDGEPVRLRPDGSFTMRLNLPDKRQVVPVIAQSGDGIEQRTAILAFERNTKYMEPVIREPDDE